MTSSNKTIGVLIDRIEDYYQNTILWAIESVAKTHGINVVCFTGGVLRSPNRFAVERNVIYDLACDSNVDGLIIASGTIVNEIGAAELSRFCKRYKPLPMCSIGVDLDQIPSVMVDNNTGMRDAVRHLVNTHGKKHIAFIRGPVVNDDAQQRYQVYKDVLKECGLKFDPMLVASGDFERGSGNASVSTFLDERGVKMDAIVAASDDMAIGAMGALLERGIKIPDEVAVVSFDDDEEARLTMPPLTTVRLPLQEQAIKATQLLIDQLEGIEVPDHVVLHTELVIRKSCGCSGQTASLQRQNVKCKDAIIEQLVTAEKNQARQRVQAEQWARTLSSVGEALITSFDTESQMNAIVEQFPKLGINSCFLVLYNGDRSPSDFSRLIMMYDQESGGAEDSRLFETALLVPRELLPDRINTYVVLPLFFEREQMGYAIFEAGPRDGNIYEALRDQISAALKGAGLMEQIVEKDRDRRRLVHYILDVTPDMHRLRPLDELERSILEQLIHLLGSPHKKRAHAEASTTGFLAIINEDSEIVIKTGVGRFEGISQIDQCVDEKTARHLSAIMKAGDINVREGQVLIPLKVGKLVLGVVYLEGPSISSNEIDFIRILSNQASVAIQNIRLYEMATLDPLTGVHARRFFDRWFLREIKSAFRTSTTLSLLMLDVDKLKVINDTGGHLAGDQALASIGRVLRKATRSNDVVGRYGGDEFAVVLPNTDEEGALRVGNRIHSLLQRETLNVQKGSLPLRSSIGLTTIQAHSFAPDKIRLQIPSVYFDHMAKSLFQLADEALYKAKRDGRNKIHCGASLTWEELDKITD